MEVVPAGRDQAVLASGDPMVLAFTSDVPVTGGIPCLALADIGALADFALANAREAAD
jgi:hypothetical protein